MYVSTGLTPTACRRTTTWPSPGVGSASSSSCNTSGPPVLCTLMAFMLSSPSLRVVESRRIIHAAAPRAGRGGRAGAGYNGSREPAARISSVRAPGLSDLLGGTARLPRGHVDAVGRAVVARARADELTLSPGAHRHAAVHAHAAAVVLRGRACRPRAQAPAHPRDAVGARPAGAAAGAARL